jgi:DNA processing protein
MKSSIRKLKKEEFPELLQQIEDPPEELFVKGEMPEKDSVFLCVVGSRKASNYGKEACSKIIEKLSRYRVVIVSGLALGIDSYAHREALKAGLKTVAVPGSGLDSSVIYPRSHLNLAHEIVNSGGALLSEYKPDFKATSWSFPKRNRIMAGMSQGVLVIEAEKKSGSLITARLSLEYNREVCAVPGSIFSSTSSGTNYLIQQGAYPVTSAKDICNLFKLEKIQNSKLALKEKLSKNETLIMKYVKKQTSKNEVIAKSGLSVSEANCLITSLELKGLIKESGGVIFPKQD